jgi:hypothetical protein
MSKIFFSQIVIKVSDNKAFRIYPNPSSGIYTVHCNKPDENSVILVYDCFGKLVLKIKPESNETHLDLSGQSPGVYVVKFVSDTNVYQQKIIKL